MAREDWAFSLNKLSGKRFALKNKEGGQAPVQFRGVKVGSLHDFVAGIFFSPDRKKWRQQMNRLSLTKNSANFKVYP
jgi:hypothetical protein